MFVQYEKIAQWRWRETNTAQGKDKCCIQLETIPSCYFFHTALTVVVKLVFIAMIPNQT